MVLREDRASVYPFVRLTGRARRINRIMVVKVGAEPRVYTGDEEGRITAWARPSPGVSQVELLLSYFILFDRL